MGGFLHKQQAPDQDQKDFSAIILIQQIRIVCQKVPRTILVSFGLTLCHGWR